MAKQHGSRKFKCQLNNETKTTKHQDLLSNSVTFNYFEPIEVSKGVSLPIAATHIESKQFLFNYNLRGNENRNKVTC